MRLHGSFHPTFPPSPPFPTILIRDPRTYMCISLGFPGGGTWETRVGTRLGMPAYSHSDKPSMIDARLFIFFFPSFHLWNLGTSSSASLCACSMNLDKTLHETRLPYPYVGKNIKIVNKRGLKAMSKPQLMQDITRLPVRVTDLLYSLSILYRTEAMIGATSVWIRPKVCIKQCDALRIGASCCSR